MDTDVKKVLAASRNAHIHLVVDDGKRVVGELTIKCYVADDGVIVAFDPEPCWLGKWPKKAVAETVKEFRKNVDKLLDNASERNSYHSSDGGKIVVHYPLFKCMFWSCRAYTLQVELRVKER